MPSRIRVICQNRTRSQKEKLWVSRMCADNSESAGYVSRRRRSPNPRQFLLRGSESSLRISHFLQAVLPRMEMAKTTNLHRSRCLWTRRSPRRQRIRRAPISWPTSGALATPATYRDEPSHLNNTTSVPGFPLSARSNLCVSLRLGEFHFPYLVFLLLG